jgi:FkbH-like protein
VKVAILGNSGIDFLPEPVRAAMGRKGLPAEVWAAGFNQYRQAILDPGSQLYAFGPDFVLLYLSAEDLFPGLFDHPLAVEPEACREMVDQALIEIRDLASRIVDGLPRTTIVLTTLVAPATGPLTGLEYNTPYQLRTAIASFNLGLASLRPSVGRALVLDVEALASWMGQQAWVDPRLWLLARSRLGAGAIQALARSFACLVAGSLGRNRKCIILDLDNTLWGGVVGESGPAGIALGDEGMGLAFAEFQAALRNLARKGILLALCSKNNPDDALEVIRMHPGMRLREEHFAAMRLNWDDKATNIRDLARELNLGLDAMVFVDDNPVERARVVAALPEVAVPDWPVDPGDYVRALRVVEEDHFLKVSVTAEDLNRTELYRLQAQRQGGQAPGQSLEDFYRSLGMKARVRRADPFALPRVAQLTQKTNQFNLTTRRFTEAEVQEKMARADQRVYTLELEDRFGSSGLVGVLIAREVRPSEWTLEVFLLSCRVMGRTVEHAFLGAVAGELHRQGARRLIGEYLPTAKNKPVSSLFADLGFAPMPGSDPGRFWVWELEARPFPVPPWIEVVVA